MNTICAQYAPGQLAAISADLLSIYPDMGGMPMDARCKYVVDPANAGQNVSPPAQLRNRSYCLNEFANRDGSKTTSDFYRAFRDEWRGLMRTGPNGERMTFQGGPYTSAQLRDPNFACDTLVSTWAPAACTAEPRDYAPTTPWLQYCAAFAYYYNGHYKILNNFVRFVDRYVTGHGGMEWFEFNYNFMMANGPLRWNASGPAERFETLQGKVTTPYACEWINWNLPDRVDTWQESGLPGQFWAKLATVLDEGLAQMPVLPYSLVAFKGMDSDPKYFSSVERFYNIRVGTTFTMDGYNSTTLDLNVALAYTCDLGGEAGEQGDGHCGVFVYRLPAGTRCSYKHDNTNYTYQILLPRKRRFRVVSNTPVPMYGRTVHFVECELLNPDSELPHFQTDCGLTTACELGPRNQWATALYEDYEEFTKCGSPVVPLSAYTASPMPSALLCYLQMQQLAIPVGDCKGACSLRDIYPDNAALHTTMYRVVTADDTGGLVNGNSADLEGQLTYAATYLPSRHADWATRVLQKYPVTFAPDHHCGDAENPNYMCPPYGLYAKCNPAGCAGNTHCKHDSDCPGKGGVCTHGKCVCCGPGNACSNDRQCGKGQCVNSVCQCKGIDLAYKCNVAEYPSHTNSVMGASMHVGAVRAPFDPSSYPEGAWVPGGWWYSTPDAGQCQPGQQVGKDCYWETPGVEKQFTLKELAQKGFKMACKQEENPGITCYSKEEVMSSQEENLALLQQLYG